MDDKGIATSAEITAFLKRTGKTEIPKCPPTNGLNQTAAEAAELEAHRERQWQLRKEHNFARRDGGAVSKRGRPAADAPVMIHSPPPPRAPVTSPKQAKARATEPRRTAKYAQTIVALRVDLNAGKAARELGVPVSTVYRWAKAEHINLTGKGGRQFSAEKEAQIAAALAVGHSAAKVARELGVGHSTVYRRAKAAPAMQAGSASEPSSAHPEANQPIVPAPFRAPGFKEAPAAAAKPPRRTFPSTSDPEVSDPEVISGAEQRLARARAAIRRSTSGRPGPR